MSSSLVAALCLIGVALGAAAAVGLLIKRRSGKLRESSGQRNRPVGGADLGLSTTGPTVVHFSAVWCGPCGAVRRVVDEVCRELPDVAHREIDIDANPAAARSLSVLSLPSTFIFDSGGRQRYRTAGVPKAADLRSALVPLLARPRGH
ncbi:MAG: thioredoxin family protein [Mycobacteriaceae bacterium]|nr:thioredoxin family protein [Mycobacteriaceae bacterium]